MDNFDESEEINACSIKQKVTVNGKQEDYLIMFKNETHNHPTEIEPFGGAATCLGGAIRDPLSGRSYVYNAMRVTGSGDPSERIEDTMPGKLPQRKITKDAAHGYTRTATKLVWQQVWLTKSITKATKQNAWKSALLLPAHPQKT